MNTIDLICLLPLALALVNGYRKGFIIEIATLVAFIAAIAACFTLTGTVMHYLQPVVKQSKWLPFISYIVTFVLVYLLILWIGKILEKVVKIVQLGLLNRLSGMVFSFLKMCFIISLVFWLADYVRLIPEKVQKQSYAYKALDHFAPGAINYLSTYAPFLKKWE